MAQRRFSRFFPRLFTRLTLVYGLLLFIILLLRLTIGERWQIIALLNNNLHLLLMPSLVLLPLSLWGRRWRLSLLLSPAAVTWVSASAIFFLPQTVAVPPDSVPMRLLTYNLHAERHILQPMFELVRESGADVVALQEMSRELSEVFDTELTDVYPYRALYAEPNDNPYHGRGILSRYPILENRVWPAKYPIPIRLQRVVLDVAGTAVTVYNFHAPPSTPIWGQGYDTRPRAAQIADLLELARQDSGPVILMGDFNTTDLDENYRRITTQFHDAFREVGWGLGYTNPDWSTDQAREGLPFVPLYQRIDYVFYNEAFTAIEARVWSSSGGSDHRPLYAVLALNPAP